MSRTEIDNLINEYNQLEDKLEWVDPDLDGELCASENAKHNFPLEKRMGEIEDILYEKYGMVI